jgi:DNA repair protein RecO (recombination protein O)
MIVSTDAVILRSIKYGDTSRIITAYTRSHGTTTLIAKGARGPKPRFRSAIEVMTRSQLVYYRKESRDIQMLSQADSLDNHPGLQSDPNKLMLGFAVIEFANAAIRGEEAHEEIFELLRETLSMLDRAERNPGNILLRFLVRFSAELGFALDLRHCARCRGDLSGEIAVTGNVHLEIREGAFCCSECSEGASGIVLAADAFKGLQWAAACEPSRLPTLALRRSSELQALRALHLYIAAHVQGMRAVHTMEMMDAGE